MIEVPANVAEIIPQLYKLLAALGVTMAIFTIFMSTFSESVTGGTHDRE